MDARTYLNTLGEDRCKALVDAVNADQDARAAGVTCSLGYFKQIAYGYRRPSFELAKFLVKHSTDPRGALDVVALLEARKKKDPSAADPVVAPAAGPAP